MASADSLLVLRALGLGDLLTAVPALRALRRGFPDGDIALAAPAWLAPLVTLTGAVDRLVPTADMDELGLLQPAPDLADQPARSWPAEHRCAAAFGCWADREPSAPGPPRRGRTRTGTTTSMRCVAGVGWSRRVGLLADPADLQLDPPSTDALVTGAVVVHPGASSGSRRWPWRRFATVAAVLAGRGHHVVVTGTTAEAELCRDVVRGAELPAERDLAGRLGLDEAAALIAAASLVICGDTGIAHLASAYATPSVLLFGPTSPARWGPPSGGPHTVLWSGSVGDPHAAQIDPGLASITVEQVLTAIDERLTHANRLPTGPAG